MTFRFLLGLFLLTGLTVPASSAELSEKFDAGNLDQAIWDVCQADYPRLVAFREDGQNEPKQRYLSLSIDEDRGNVDECVHLETATDLQAPEEGEIRFDDMSQDFLSDFGMSLIAPKSLESAAECDDGDEDNVQRNELRLLQNKHIHNVVDPHWYSIRFRLNGDIPPCGSSRWITAQWKYKFKKKWQHKDYKPNPVVAQRFDNGVLHVTVQNERCRCMVAVADGDPYFKPEVAQSFAAPETLTAERLKETAPLKCFLSGEDFDGSPPSCTPSGFKLLTIDGTAPPRLPDPKKDWVTMTYRIKGTDRHDGLIDIYANGSFITRVTGLIGYEKANPGKVKFKFGVYRAGLPGTAAMDVDEICISENIEACQPALTTFD